ncbi:hypothetical protein D9758_011411 [Tetrapyrgos nigripes]|uniref:Uncharacterized protein n=1 Tax=Tetrapyrgos nigripes TaxID=182062 RepID=A0A8H5CQ08_9AGAR|nr:hypothetical protein D9758_011411 [Tetrapyrgos nigripes]
MTPPSPTSFSVTTMASSFPLIQNSRSSSSSEEERPKATRRRSLGVPVGVADVANLFVKMRRSSDRAKNAKSNHIISSSGDTPLSHPGVQEAVQSRRRERLEAHEVFYCIGAVNVPTLLRVVRGSLIETTEMLGGNVLLDEQWECTICPPKNRANGTFKVTIRHSASAAKADIVDPHRPIALEKAKGVPGLMTIVRREE